MLINAIKGKFFIEFYFHILCNLIISLFYFHVRCKLESLLKASRMIIVDSWSWMNEIFVGSFLWVLGCDSEKAHVVIPGFLFFIPCLVLIPTTLGGDS